MIDFVQIRLGQPVTEPIRPSIMGPVDCYRVINDFSPELREHPIGRIYWERSLLEPTPRRWQIQSIFLRLHEATQNPDLLYWDLDAQILRLPQFDRGTPYFGEMKTSWIAQEHPQFNFRYLMRKAADCLFYVNGCTKFFADLLEESLLYNFSYGSIFSLLNYSPNFNRFVRLIPEECYLHEGGIKRYLKERMG